MKHKNLTKKGEKIMKKLKKVLMSCMILTLSFGGSSFASENKSSSGEYSINEYELVKQLEQKSDTQLRSIGYDDEEINQIRNYDELFKENIEEIKSIDEDVLKNDFQYTDEQIDVIQNFDGSESQMAKASASVTVKATKNSSSLTSKLSKLNVKIRFVWSGVPAIQFNDSFAMVNSENMFYDNKSTLFTCTYVAGNGYQKTYQFSLKANEAGTTGADVSFPVYKNYGTKYYLKSGSANVSLGREHTSANRIITCGIGVAYGHVLVPSTSINVTYKGLGITFSGKVSKTDDTFKFTL